MKRLGEYKAASHEDALAAHLALTLEERLARSWQLYELFRDEARSREGDDDDVARFYARARDLGLCPW